MTKVSLCKLGKIAQAEVLLKKGISLNPNSLYLLTAAYLINYKLEKKESLQQYREMINHHPQKIKLLDQYFFWHYSRLPDRKQTNAIALAELLIFVHPTKRFGYLLLAKIMIHQQEYKLAFVYIKKGLQSIPEDFNLLAKASEIQMLLCNYDAALEYSNKIFKSYPNNWKSYALLAQNYFYKQLSDRSLQVIDLGLKAIPDQQNLLAIGLDISRNTNYTVRALKYLKLLRQHLEASEANSLYDNANKVFNNIIGTSRVDSQDEDIIPDQGRISYSNYTDEPQLFILAGLPGSGKSTLLNSYKLNTDILFPQSTKIVPKQLFNDDLKFQSSLEHKMSTLCLGNYMRAYAGNSYFDYVDIPRLCREPINQCKLVMHIDLRHLLLAQSNKKITGFDPRTHKELMDGNSNKKLLRNFFSHPFFTVYRKAFITTISLPYELNNLRFCSRTSTQLFDVGPKASELIYEALMRSWNETLDQLKLVGDNIVIEQESTYKFIARKNYYKKI